MALQAPLAYFHGTATGWYGVVFPVFVVGDDPASLTFRVSADALAESVALAGSSAEGEDARRAYVTRLTKQRLHQQGFRRRVMLAYHTRCAVCELRRDRLLDAAHILPDGDPRSEPVVSSGLSLCKLHHAAFDADLLGIRPDLTVELNVELLREKDGPMLLHGLQGFQDQPLSVPSRTIHRPNREFITERYARFLRAG
jgi:putative restriction endonuclease